MAEIVTGINPYSFGNGGAVLIRQTLRTITNKPFPRRSATITKPDSVPYIPPVRQQGSVTTETLTSRELQEVRTPTNRSSGSRDATVTQPDLVQAIFSSCHWDPTVGSRTLTPRELKRVLGGTTCSGGYGTPWIGGEGG